MEDKLYNFRIQPAERLSSVQEYYFSVKLKEVARMNAEGKDIISLAIGSPDMPPSPQTIETLCEEARHANAHGYQPTTGIPELRRAMADFYKRWYDVDLDPACEIQPLIGSKEGILHVTLALANPGDRVLVPNPGYPTYTSLSKILGQRITYYDLLPENGWQPDFKALEEMDLTGVKIMWTNYPNMPTGANARQLAEKGFKIFRAGVWKPRTKPGGFEGMGEAALPWLQRVKEETGMLVSTEVAMPKHVEASLKAGVDLLWVGARTTANPFAMQELADSLKGVDIPVLVKNPVNPDIELWIGALERINGAGITRLGAIHRGFSSYDQKIFRNAPMWHLPIELHRGFPNLPVF